MKIKSNNIIGRTGSIITSCAIEIPQMQMQQQITFVESNERIYLVDRMGLRPIPSTNEVIIITPKAILGEVELNSSETFRAEDQKVPLNYVQWEKQDQLDYEIREGRGCPSKKI